jgi:hypothetical protein
MPGVRDAVVEHEEWGERTRNVFFGVLGLELVALALRRVPKARPVEIIAAATGVVGVFCLYEAGAHGGRLVYSYAGGVGIRSGDPQDVGRLLLAGLYQQAQVDRKNGRGGDAATLIDEAQRRFPNDVEIRLLAAESTLLDRGDPRGAVAALDGIAVPNDNRVLRLRYANLRADALEASGMPQAAIEVLRPLAEEFPTNARLRQRLEKLQAAVPAPRP